ncbi:MAG: carbohydrate kinase family protein [Desulfovibrionaceae bacterium]|nr:carbohydrate kinase family protein [Desulfovibrionaceae bacterium]
MSIYVSGSVAYDRIMTFPGYFEDYILPDKLHIVNISFLVDDVREHCGGTAANIAYTAALLGEKPITLASVGKDFERYERRMQAVGMSLEGIRVVEDEFTALCFITTDKADNQITGFCPSSMNYPCKYEFKTVDPARDLAVVAAGNMQDMLHFPAQYKKLGLRYIYDPSQQIPRFSAEELLESINGAFMFISNDYELEMVMKITGYSKQDLLELTPNIVTTLGDQGCFLLNSDGEVHIPAVLVEGAKDPTGAGDSLRGGMLAALHQGKGLIEALQMGTVAASFCVEQHGTQEHCFDLETFRSRYDKAFGSGEE